MKRYILLINIILFMFIDVFSQLTLQYYKVSGGDYSIGETAVNWETDNIISDFGMRINPGGSIWHQGVDFNDNTTSATGDYGYPLLSPFNGTVKKLEIGSYKVLSFQDNLGNNYNLGYGHIFSDAYATLSTPVVRGKFVLYKFLYNGEHYAIINTLTNVAISDINGYSFTYTSTDGQPYTTTNQIITGQAIAPLGGSGGYMTVPHLHLYRFVDPVANQLQYHNKPNCKDPLQILDHIYTYYSTDIETQNLTLSGSNTYYSGANKSIIKVRCNMINPGEQCCYYYTNTIMDIDDVDVKIKKISEDNTSYSLMHGINYLSKISHGARWGGNPYPNSGTDKIRDAYGVYSTNANSCKIGIKPGAYALSGAYDNFIFTDFYTRIHKDHNLNGTLTLAENPDDALYNDGNYHIKADITTIKGSQQNSVTPTEIQIDNFRPYIKEVEVFKGAMNDVNLVYRGKWEAVGNTLTCSPEGTRYCFTGSEILIKVETSESLEENSLNLQVDIAGQPTSLNITPYYSNNENTLFFFKIEGSQTQNIIYIPSKKAILKFTGTDMSGNQLEAIPTGTDIIENNGIELGKINVLLLKKVEELTLYVIQLNNKLKEQQTQINKLNKLNNDEK